MARNNRFILTLLISVPIILGVLYICGFIYSFRNYGDTGGWKAIKEYEFDTNKAIVEENIKNIASTNPGSIWFADTSQVFSKDGWFTIFLKTQTDTVQYIYRFSGDSSSWKKEKKSKIILFKITDDFNYIPPTTNKGIDKNQTQKWLVLFESILIKHIN